MRWSTFPFSVSASSCKGWNAFISACYWFFRWLALVLIITAGGAVIGAVLFSVVGLAFQMDYRLSELLRNGLRDGGFYAFIWAPGVSFVLCVMKAYKNSR